jgi:hypothetical protein
LTYEQLQRVADLLRSPLIGRASKAVTISKGWDVERSGCKLRLMRLKMRTRAGTCMHTTDPGTSTTGALQSCVTTFSVPICIQESPISPISPILLVDQAGAIGIEVSHPAELQVSVSGIKGISRTSGADTNSSTAGRECRELASFHLALPELRAFPGFPGSLEHIEIIETMGHMERVSLVCLEVRLPQRGDVFWPWWRERPLKLKQFLRGLKVPPSDRDGALLLCRRAYRQSTDSDSDRADSADTDSTDTDSTSDGSDTVELEKQQILGVMVPSTNEVFISKAYNASASSAGPGGIFPSFPSILVSIRKLP